MSEDTPASPKAKRKLSPQAAIQAQVQKSKTRTRSRENVNSRPTTKKQPTRTNPQSATSSQRGTGGARQTARVKESATSSSDGRTTKDSRGSVSKSAQGKKTTGGAKKAAAGGARSSKSSRTPTQKIARDSRDSSSGGGRVSAGGRSSSEHRTAKLNKGGPPRAKRPTMTAEEREERAAAAAKARRNGRLIWVVCIVVTLACVAGAVHMLMNHEGGDDEGGDLTTERIFLLDLVDRGNIESKRVQENGDLKDAIDDLSDKQRSALGKGMPLTPTMPARPRSMLRCAESGLSTKVRADHPAMKRIYEDFSAAKKAIRGSGDGSLEDAVVTLYELRAETLWLMKNAKDYIGPIDDPVAAKVHGKVEENVYRLLESWQNEMVSITNPKQMPQVGEAALRVKKGPESAARTSLIECNLFYSYLGGDYSSLDDWLRKAHEWKDDDMVEEHKILAARFGPWSEDVKVSFVNAHADFQRTLLDKAREERDGDLTVWNGWVEEQEKFVASYWDFITALREVVENADIGDKPDVKDRMQKMEASWSAMKADLDKKKAEVSE